jgi:hypothetical protein
MMLGGLLLIVSLPGFAFGGLQLVGLGALLLVILALERNRYRSAVAEQTNAAPGPGGGEPPDGQLEPRFRATSEVFIDPTSGHRMRVLVDPTTGERRYVAEG